MTSAEYLKVAEQTNVADELRNFLKLLEYNINALYRLLPGGQRNYGSDNSEIGKFSLEHHSSENVGLVWTLSRKSRRRYHGSVSRDIATFYVNNHTYDLHRIVIPDKRLKEDTERLMELLGFTEDKDSDVD